MLDEQAVSSENPQLDLTPPENDAQPHLPTPPQPPQRQPASPESLLQLGVVIGVILIALGILVVRLRGEELPEYWFGQTLPLGDIGLGLLIGFVVSAVMWFAGDVIEGFKIIRQRLVDTLDFQSLQWWQIVVLSLFAAFPEEIFFRGALQPLVGLIITAVIFGALHSVTRLYFAYATLAGLGLGLLVQWRGDLWMAIAVHFAVDFVGLGVMKWWVNQQSALAPSPED